MPSNRIGPLLDVTVVSFMALSLDKLYQATYASSYGHSAFPATQLLIYLETSDPIPNNMQLPPRRSIDYPVFQPNSDYPQAMTRTYPKTALSYAKIGFGIGSRFVLPSAIFIMGSFLLACRAENQPDYEKLRAKMVDEQIAQRGIDDTAVLKAIGKVPRHLFVPADRRPWAYRDHPLPIGHKQTISQPYIVAYMTEALELDGDERVLEIGTGSGYQAAVLGEIVAQVYSIEIVEPLARRATQTLDELGYKNITVKHGDGYQGWPEHAPFDAIIVTAAPPKIPQALLDQLAVGGRMIVPVGERYQELTLIRRTQDGVDRQKLLPVRFVPMVRGDE